METITNAASAAATTVSSLIYGQPAKDTETTGNETAGKEPLSGEQGKGTLNEPFDKGNAENPTDTSSKTTGNTSYKADDFLPLNPTLGKPTNTEPSTYSKSGTSSETAMPIVPLNPDVATMGGGTTNNFSSTEAGAMDKTGVSDKVYKETPLDDIKLSGAPGAGPSAPEFTPATPEANLTSSTSDKPSTSNKPSEHHSVDPAKDSTTTGTHKDSAAPKKESVGSEIDAILHKTPKAEHSVDDRAVESPHAKMTDKTVRHTEAAKSGEGGEPKSLVAESSARKSESGAASPTGGDEKSGKKISALKDKLKDKLHIGSKDK